jgi:hypothetical protein
MPCFYSPVTALAHVVVMLDVILGQSQVTQSQSLTTFIKKPNIYHTHWIYY